MSIAGQSVLTWPPSQIIMTSLPVTWTSYLATMATNPAVRYSLDLKISCTRSDSGFEDSTVPHKDSVHVKAVPFKSTTSSAEAVSIKDTPIVAEPIPFQDTTSSHNNNFIEETTSVKTIPLKDTTSSIKSTPTNSTTSCTRTATMVPWRQSKQPTPPPAPSPRSSLSKASSLQGTRPQNPQKSLPTSDTHTWTLSNPSTDSSLAGTRPRRQQKPLPTANTHARTNSIPSRPPSSRRSSYSGPRRPPSRTNSFLLSRQPPPEIDLRLILQRTRTNASISLSDPSAPPPREPSPPPPPPPVVPAANIDWMHPATRRAQYRSIDRESKGLRRIWGRVRRKLFGRGEGGCVGFYEEKEGDGDGDGDGDGGSVRRYRMDLGDEEKKEEGGVEWREEKEKGRGKRLGGLKRRLTTRGLKGREE